MAKYLQILVLLLVGCEGPVNNPTFPATPTSKTAPVLKESRTLPLLHNESYWGSFNSQPIVNCLFDQCFPKNLDATIACDARCLFTTTGYGLPEAVVRAFKDKKPVAHGQNATFIVAYGPPASGKSSILSVLERSLGHEFHDLDQTTILVNVDDIFQGGEVGKLYKKYRETLIARAKSDAERELDTQRLYTYYRWVADQIADGILNQALAAKYNILWETTGGSRWPRREIGRINSYGYKTLVVYPLVETEALIERAKKRAEMEGQEAMPADQLRKGVDTAQTNLVDLLPATTRIKREECPLTERFADPADPNACRAQRVILIDNNGEKGSEFIVFDSKNPKQFCDLNTKPQLKDLLEQTILAFSKCDHS